MLLNRIEFAFMNSPLKAAIQKHLHAPLLERTAGKRKETGKALEIGCGRGVGVQIILNRFNARTVDAFDLDPRMIDLAKRRLTGLNGVGRLWMEDATHISVPDMTYDSVFDFGAIHHIPDWQRAVAEVYRLLKPNGYFYALEVLKGYITNPICRKIFKHPQENRFDYDLFKSALESMGFVIIGSNQLWNSLGWYVGKKEDRANKPIQPTACDVG